MAILTVNNIKKMFGTDVIIQNITFEVQKGDRIGQLVIMPVVIPEFTYAESAERGTGAFGSSGR